MLNIPNALTGLRLLSLPLVIVLFRSGHDVWACAVFLLGMATDCVDGWLAKRLNQRTTAGLYLDPVVDKIVILALFFELSWAHVLPYAISTLMLTRELLHNGVRCCASSQGTVIGANWMGKTKAALQTVLIAGGLLIPSPPPPLNRLYHLFAWLVLALSWGFFVAFLVRNRSLLSQATRSAAPAQSETDPMPPE